MEYIAAFDLLLLISYYITHFKRYGLMQIFETFVIRDRYLPGKFQAKRLQEITVICIILFIISAFIFYTYSEVMAAKILK